MVGCKDMYEQESIPNLVEMILSAAVERQATRVRFKRYYKPGKLLIEEDCVDSGRFSGSETKHNHFEVLFENDGIFREVAEPPLALWN